MRNTKERISAFITILDSVPKGKKKYDVREKNAETRVYKILTKQKKNSILINGLIRGGTRSGKGRNMNKNMSKEKDKNKKWILIVGLAAAAAVVLAVFMPVLTAWAKRTFSTPAEYYRYAEKKSAEKIIADVCEWYSGKSEKDSSPENGSEQRTLLFEMGEGFGKLIGMGTDTGNMGIGKFGLALETVTEQNGLKSVVSGAVSLNGMRILNAEMLLDLEENLMYARLLELSEKYLAVGLEDVFFADFKDEEMNEAIDAVRQLYNSVPDEKKVGKLLERYVTLALSCIEKVEKKTGTVNVGNISKRCTELIVTVDGVVLRKMAETVLSAMTEDQELKELITEILASQDAETEEKTYREFCDSLTELMDDLTALDNMEALVMTVRVDYKGKIIGRSITFADGVEFSYAFPANGKKIGCEVSVKSGGTKISFEGEGARKREWFSGEFKLKVMGFRIAEFHVAKLNLKDWQNGQLNGTITLAPAGMLKTLLKETAGENNSLFDESSLILSGTGEEKGIKIVLENRGEQTVALTYKKTERKGEKISFPSEEQVVKTEDKEAFTAWLKETDQEAFFEKLEEAGVPSEWIQALSDSLSAYGE